MSKDRMSKYKTFVIIFLILSFALFAAGCPRAGSSADPTTQSASSAGTPSGTTVPSAPSSTTTLTPTKKPAIYLYPLEETAVHVQLAYRGRLTCTYPAYPDDGWKVTAFPNGRLIDRADGREYSYLYWEGLTDVPYDFSKGFVVAGHDTAAFLQEKLAYLGLTPREYNEFIVFWLPQMQDNPFNLITFQGQAYTDSAVLTIEPRPDSLLRVFMAYKTLQEKIAIEPQDLPRGERKGYTVVEWGGTCSG